MRAKAASEMERCALPNWHLRIQISDIHSCREGTYDTEVARVWNRRSAARACESEFSAEQNHRRENQKNNLIIGKKEI
ncbi:hypothetical protein EVAR_77637_1 [Eumeta japonica]|uniref:Uncharacterized protein n=1 Tax=Eumeta variegata TaxID=151549 RepID=A0A4C1T7S5_EUMVA|nr:hypothetical protein EVAR_77637_1 [Eumeta japonica]